MFQCFKEKRTPSDDKTLKEKDTTFRWGTPQKARWGREKDSGAFSREGSPGHSLRSTDDDGGDDDSDDGGDDDGYPAYSHHDKIPPWWEYVSNDKGGNVSVTKSHHT